MIKVLAYLSSSYSRVMRCEQIFKYLNRTGEFECVVSPEGVTDKALLWADIIFVKETVDPQALAMYWAYKMERNKILVVDRDDAVQVEEAHPLAEQHKEVHASSWQKELLKIATHVTCTNQILSKEIQPFNNHVTVIPNYLDMELWDNPMFTNTTDRLRIGWAGSVTHRQDMDLAIPALKRILEEFPKVKFYSCGDPYARDILGDRCEFIPGTANMYWWPQLAQTLMFDIAIAPLVDNHFNQCRSPLKYLEYGMLGSAGVYSPTVYGDYVKDGETGLITTDFYESIKKLILDVQLRKMIKQKARVRVKSSYSLANHYAVYSRLFKNLLDGRNS